MSGAVLFEISDSLARVTLSHPGKFNAMSRAMWRELRAAFETIQQRGFLNQVLAADALDAAVQERIHRIQQLAPQAARLNKASFRAITHAPIAQLAINLIATAYDYAASGEHREGIIAFMEKRPPAFSA